MRVVAQLEMVTRAGDAAAVNAIVPAFTIPGTGDLGRIIALGREGRGRVAERT